MSSTSPRPVAVLANSSSSTASHDVQSLVSLAQRIAALLDVPFAGLQPAGAGHGHYWVPQSTLLQSEAETLGIASADDFFGGLVPFAFMKGKTVVHSRRPGAASAPAGWCDDLGERITTCTLPGYSAFSRDDADAAARDLLAHGPVRFKPGDGIGGARQVVVPDEEALHAPLRDHPFSDWLEHGVVIERNLVEVRTHSVGTARIGGIEIAYHGWQRGIRHRGHEVYAGSDLHVIRGSLADLRTVKMKDVEQNVIGHACEFDRAVSTCYPALCASRRNYDIAVGTGHDGVALAGVLDQSWRIGGATPAELAAMEYFRSRPDVTAIAASCFESYEAVDVPADAVVHYMAAAQSPVEGPLLKFSLIRPDGHER